MQLPVFSICFSKYLKQTKTKQDLWFSSSPCSSATELFLGGGNQCYPVCSAEVDSFSKVVALVEAAVIGSRKGHHKLSSALIGPIHLREKKSGLRVY